MLSPASKGGICGDYLSPIGAHNPARSMKGEWIKSNHIVVCNLFSVAGSGLSSVLYGKATPLELISSPKFR